MKIIEFASLIILTAVVPFLAYQMGQRSENSYLNQIRKDRDKAMSQTEEAIKVAQRWEDLHNAAAKTRDEALAMLQEKTP